MATQTTTTQTQERRAKQTPNVVAVNFVVQVTVNPDVLLITTVNTAMSAAVTNVPRVVKPTTTAPKRNCV